MTPEPSVSDLYKKLRKATLKRDNAEALSLLKQIVQLNPNDLSAKKQLDAALAQAIKIPVDVRPTKAPEKKGARQATGKLYRKLRSARLAKDDLKAFEIIQEILQLEPDDTEALLQRKELGARIAVRNAQELEEVLKTGDPGKISQTVEKFQKLAEEDTLDTLPNYAAARAIHDKHLKLQNEKRLEELLAELSNLTSEYDREQKAQQIESYATKHHLTLTSLQQEELSACHAAWRQVCVESEQYEILDKLITQYKKIKEQLILGEKLEQIRDELANLQQELKNLSEVPEAEDILQQTNITAKKIIDKIKQVQHTTKVKTLIWGLVTSITLASIGLTLYAYSNVKEKTAEFTIAFNQKNITAAKTLVADAYPMSKLYSLVNSQYAEWLSRLTSWVNNYDKGVKQIQQFEKWLDANLGKWDITTAKSFYDEYARNTKFIEEFSAIYHFSISSDLKHKQEVFLHEITTHLNNTILTKYGNPPADAGIEELANIFSDYKNFRDSFPLISQEGMETINKAFHSRVQRILNNSRNNVSECSRNYELLKKHASTLEIADEMLNMADKLKKESDALLLLPKNLSTCRTFSQYINILTPHTEALSIHGRELKLAEMEQIQSNLPALSMRLKMEKLVPAAAGLSDAEMLKTLERIKKAYSGQGSLFINYTPSEYNRLVNLLTLPEKAPEWSDSYTAITKNRYVYIGKPSKINGQIHIRELTPSMKDQNKSIEIGEPDKKEQITLKNFRSQMGISRLELQKGIVLPTVLMQNLAKDENPGHPTLAKAYLYSLSIDLLSIMNEINSGIVFSQQLKSDIQEFQELKSWAADNGSPVAPKSWCKRHRLSIDERFDSFFREVANHNYAKEIHASINYILENQPDFAGYFNSEGQFIKINDYPNKELYYCKNNKLVLLSKEKGIPYHPVFHISPR